MSEVSSAERDLIIRKHERAMQLRCEYFRQITNPHVCATGSAGHIFDHQFIRFQAMRVNNVEHFKPTVKSFRYGLFIALPIILFGYAAKTERAGREKKIRTGQVAYKDRKLRFI